MLSKIKYFYIFLFLLPLLAPMSVNVFYFLFAFFLIAISFFLLRLGYGVESVNIFVRGDSINSGLSPLLLMITPAVAFYVVNFYTGNSPLEVLNNIASGNSNYKEYQTYFAEEKLHEFSVSKIPAIVGLFFLKAMLILSVVRYNMSRRKIREMFFVFFPVFSHIYVSVGRGTSLELFELFALIYFVSEGNASAWTKKKVRRVTILACVALISLFLFNFNISIRSEVGCVTKDMCFQENIISLLPWSLDKTIYGLVGYFSFGLYYTHYAFSSFFFIDFISTISFFLPYFSASLSGVDDLRTFICSDVIDCGAAWQPDIVTYMFNYGALLTLTFIYMCGRFCKKLEYKKNSKNGLWATSTQFMMFMFLLSLPFGNIVTNSSSNVLTFGLFIVMFFYRERIQREHG